MRNACTFRDILAVIALAPALCFGQQFFDLKTTPNGGLYFRAPAQLTGDTEVPSGSRLFVSTQGVIRPFPTAQSIVSYDISAGGGVVALNTGRQAILVNSEGHEWMRLDGTARLSRNGRYAAVEFQQSVSLVDIERREVLFTITEVTLPRGQVLADNGLILALGPEPVLLRSGTRQPAGLLGPPGYFWTSAYFYLEESGRSVAFIAGNTFAIQILGSNASRDLLIQTSFAAPILHYDGLSVTYAALTAVKRQRLDGSPAQTLCATQSNIAEAAVASSRCFFTSGISLYEQDAASGVTKHLASAVNLTNGAGAVTHGIAVTWSLRTLLNVPDFKGAAPYPKQLGHYRVLVNGRPVPILAAGRTQAVPRVFWTWIQFHIPLDIPVPEDPTAVSIALDTVDGIFYSATSPPPLYLHRYGPSFPFASEFSPITRQSFIRASHSSGSPVTVAEPAQPGASITLHMQGLGAVIGNPPDDSPPVSRMPIAGSIECTVSNGIEAHKVPVESATLSLTELALYDVQIVLPTLPSIGEYFVSCEMGGRAASASIPVRRLE